VLLHLVGVPPQQIRGLLHVTERLQPVLADLHRHQRRQLVALVGHDVGGLADDRDPLLPGAVGPFVERLLGGGDGVAGVLARAARELTDKGAVDRRMRGLVPRALARLAVDEQRMLLAQPRPGDLDALVVALVEVLVVGRHRRVGDAEPFLCHGDLLCVEKAL